MTDIRHIYASLAMPNEMRQYSVYLYLPRMQAAYRGKRGTLMVSDMHHPLDKPFEDGYIALELL